MIASGQSVAEQAQPVVPEVRRRRLNGLPQQPRPGLDKWMRLLTSAWLWAPLALFGIYALCLADVWRMMSADKVLPGMTIPGFDWETTAKCARWAAPTAAVWAVVLILVDRVRPLRWILWVLAFGWGACVSIFISLYVNSWAAELLAVSAAPGDPAAASRPAVFVAPFVEEASKATILFAIAILMRHRLVSRLQAVALAGMSAIGFAFTENITYYARAMIYGSLEASTGDVEAQMSSLVSLRGLWTSFGHPTFTMMTGIGLAIGIRHRSRIVRVLAPLTGFLAAAFGHMFFNGMSSVETTSGAFMQQVRIIFAMVVITWLMVWVRFIAREYSRVRERLGDYVAMGWLRPRDPVVQGSFFRRSWLCIVAFFRGPKVFWQTLCLMRELTDLAYVRDAMVRGVVDEGGVDYEKQLLYSVQGRRGLALDESEGLRLTLNWRRLVFFWRR